MQIAAQTPQSKIVYKRNPITGVLEVFNADPISGIATGERIASLERNLITGNIEVNNYQNPKTNTSENDPNNPWTRKRHVSVFTPYEYPYESLMNEIETLNKTFQQNMYLSGQRNYSDIGKDYLMDIAANNDKIARNILATYNSFSSFPSNIKDGWHKAYFVALANDMPGYTPGQLLYENYLVYTQSNKILESFVMDEKLIAGYTIHNLSLGVGCTIDKAMATERSDRGNSEVHLYFLDEFFNNNYKLEISPAFITLSNKTTNGLRGGLLKTSGYIHAIKSLRDFGNLLNDENFALNFFIPLSKIVKVIILRPTSSFFSIVLFDDEYRNTWNINSINLQPGETINKNIYE